VAEAAEGPQFAGLVEKDVSLPGDDGATGAAMERPRRAALEGCPILQQREEKTCTEPVHDAMGGAPWLSSEPVVVNALSTAVVSL